MAGIAVASVLFLAVFQFLGRSLSLSVQRGETSAQRHQRLVLSRLLWEDLNHQPVGNPRLNGRANELSRTTARLETEQGLILDTRVKYQIKETTRGQELVRRWKWTGLQEEFRNPETLLRSKDIRFSYRDATGGWVNQVEAADAITSIKLTWSDGSIITPLRSTLPDTPAE